MSIILLPAFALFLAQTAPAPALDAIPEGQALVYFFNASGRTMIGGTQGFKVNGQQVLKLGREEYSVMPLAPGTYKFEARKELELSIEAGHSYFLVYAYRPGKSWAAGVAGQPVLFQSATEAQVRALLAEFRRKDIVTR